MLLLILINCLTLLFAFLSAVILLWREYKERYRITIAEQPAVKSFDDFHFLIVNDRDKESSRVHAEIYAFGIGKYDFVPKQQLYWEIPEYGGKFVKWTFCDMKPNSHCLLESKVPNSASEEYRKKNKDAKLPDKGNYVILLRIFSGKDLKTSYVFFFLYYPETKQLNQIYKLRKLPYWLWIRILKRKLNKSTGVNYENALTKCF